MNPKIFFFYFVFLIAFNNYSAQSKLLKTVKKDFSFSLSVGEKIVEAPFENNSVFLRNAAIVTAGTVGLFLADKGTRNFAIKNKSKFNNSLFSIDNYYGNIYSVGFSVALYGYGLLGNSPETRKLGLQAMTAVFYAGVASTLIKSILGRHRPFLNEGNLKFSPFALKDSFFSLPSGHTTVAFALSTVMANFHKNIFWETFWFGLAGLTAAARIYHDRHWVSDTFLGAAIGFGIGNLTSNINKSKASRFAFYFSPNSLRLNYVF